MYLRPKYILFSFLLNCYLLFYKDSLSWKKYKRKMNKFGNVIFCAVGERKDATRCLTIIRNGVRNGSEMGGVEASGLTVGTARRWTGCWLPGGLRLPDHRGFFRAGSGPTRAVLESWQTHQDCWAPDLWCLRDRRLTFSLQLRRLDFNVAHFSAGINLKGIIECHASGFSIKTDSFGE